MNYFVFLVLLPCILTAEILKSNPCTDGVQCSEGKYCCELPSGKSGCCNLSEGEEIKTYTLDASELLSKNASTAVTNILLAYCPGTQCGNYCIPNFKRGVCCSNPGKACPSGTRCCNKAGNSWCCKSNQHCSSHAGLCINPGIITSTTKKRVNCPGTQCGSFCIPNIVYGTCCPVPGYACPLGSRCCNNNLSQSWCCKQNQYCSLNVGMCINRSVTTSTTKKWNNCPGTQCGNYCIDNIKWGTCCPIAGYACPLGTKCCNNNIGQSWCCKGYERCSSTTGMCRNSAVITSAAILSVFVSFIMGIVCKYFL